MQTTNNAFYNETIHHTTLTNGLQVVIIAKPGYVKSHFLFATPFGAMHSRMLDHSGKEIAFKDGLAHFLEHKMFEAEAGDVMERFTEMGISANAFTSYFETAYYFSTTSDLQEPLELLLDFVQALEVSEQSVEKEKGIIIQELRMYQQMSDVRFIQELFSSMYRNHPLKNDIGGSEESVQSITLDDLYDCFRINYHPQNMMLVCVSGEDPQLLLDIVKKNQDAKKFEKAPKVEKYEYQEEVGVVREMHTFSMDITQPKYGIGIKLSGMEDPVQRYRSDISLKLLLEATFSSAGPYVQNWLDSRIINDSFSYDSEISQDYGFLIVTTETDAPEEFDKQVILALQDMKENCISETLLEQTKRKLYGFQVRMLHRFDEYAISYARNAWRGLSFFETLDILGSITMQDMKEAADWLNLTHIARIHLTGKNANK